MHVVAPGKKISYHNMQRDIVLRIVLWSPDCHHTSCIRGHGLNTRSYTTDADGDEAWISTMAHDGHIELPDLLKREFPAEC